MNTMTRPNIIALLATAVVSAIAIPNAFATGPADWIIIAPKWDGGNDKPIHKLSCWPKKDEVLATTQGNGLWTSKDGGETWQRAGQPGQAPTVGRGTCFVFDPKNDDTLWTAGMYDYGVWVTTDGGKSYKPIGARTHVNSVAIDLSDPERKTLIVGPHTDHMYKSPDAGATWVAFASNDPQGPKSSTDAIIFDRHTIIVNSVDYAPTKPNKTGIFRSEDGGATWTKVSEEQTGKSYSPNQYYTITSNGDIFWTCGTAPTIKSSDQGITWQRLQGSPSISGPIIEVAPNRLVGLTGPSQLGVSKDAGNTWTPIGKPVPFKASTFTYDAARKCFLVAGGGATINFTPDQQSKRFVATARPGPDQTQGALARWDLGAAMEGVFGL